MYNIGISRINVAKLETGIGILLFGATEKGNFRI